MRSEILLPVVLMFLATGATQAQREDDQPLPAGTDILVSPEEELFEGSGAGGIGGIEPPLETTTDAAKLPPLEEMEPTTSLAPENNTYLCPKTCTCNTEVSGYIVDCSDKNLEEFPTNIDNRATELKLQNNKLTVVPISISALKMLQILNLSDNLIRELAPGSISELPELKALKLSNNRLLEYPQELKNGFALVKLEEIDLSGNDIRSTLSVDNFSNFIVLRKLILPTSDKDFAEVLCNKMKNTLETVCVGSCLDWANDCPDAPEHIEDDFMEGKLPGTISLTSSILDVAPVEGVVENHNRDGNENSDVDINRKEITDRPSTEYIKSTTELATVEKSSTEFSLRNSAVDSSMNVTYTDDDNNKSHNAEGDIKIGATTSNTNTGAVDKSIIGIIVAGMILIVAGITIKKNWSSLKNRFGSGSPSAAERPATNGTSPEEVPLQEKDKSPV